jgi:hypothetical protein
LQRLFKDDEFVANGNVRRLEWQGVRRNVKSINDLAVVRGCCAIA